MSSIVMQFFCPLIYSILLGVTWSICTKKKFSSSLSLAYMSHILIVLFSGLLCEKLSYGIIIGIVIAIIVVAVYVLINRSKINKASIVALTKKMWSEGVGIFILFYVCCFILNREKRFVSWDEFSHWGMFIKENLRLDALYCTSELSFSHKDYVPAISLFETIWCKLTGRYSESDMYRAIQVFMFSCLMPIWEKAMSTFSHSEAAHFSKCKRLLSSIGACCFILVIPLLFNTSNGFEFYHSIYCDIAVGILFFWCVYEILRSDDSGQVYHIVTLAIGVSVLVLAKMTSMALLPLLALLIVGMFCVDGKRKNWKYAFSHIIPFAIPSGIWFWFNRYVDCYVANSGGGQSYDGMSISSVKYVFSNIDNNPITYIQDLKYTYIDAILHKDILIHGSYVVVSLALIVAMLLICNYATSRHMRSKTLVVSIWAFVSSIYYVILMYYLYATSFCEYEARELASYERYMNSFVISILFLVLALYYESGIWQKYKKWYYVLFSSVLVYLLFFNIEAFDQILPGTMTREYEEVSENVGASIKLESLTPEDASIYVINRGDKGRMVKSLRYYCNPRIIDGESIGPVIDEYDVWTIDLSANELLETLKKYDYVYLYNIDDEFKEKYGSVFTDESIASGDLISVSEGCSL